MNPVWKIGHSTLAAEAFVELLQRHTVSVLKFALTVAGVEVRHIMSLDDARPHQLTPFACVEDGRITYPGPLD